MPSIPSEPGPHIVKIFTIRFRGNVRSYGLLKGRSALQNRTSLCGSPARRGQRQQRGGLAVWIWGGTVVSTWVT